MSWIWKFCWSLRPCRSIHLGPPLKKCQVMTWTCMWAATMRCIPRGDKDLTKNLAWWFGKNLAQCWVPGAPSGAIGGPNQPIQQVHCSTICGLQPWWWCHPRGVTAMIASSSSHAAPLVPRSYQPLVKKEWALVTDDEALKLHADEAQLRAGLRSHNLWLCFCEVPQRAAGGSAIHDAFHQLLWISKT